MKNVKDNGDNLLRMRQDYLNLPANVSYESS